MAAEKVSGVPDAAYWRNYFRYYDTLTHLIPYGDLMTAVVDAIAPLDGLRVLDAGSGTGNFSVRIVEKGGRVVALDNIREALQLHQAKQAGAVVLLADLLTPLPFADGTFDAVVANNVVWAMPPARRPNVVAELWRVLKPGGRVAVATVHKDFSPVRIYLNHARREAERDGWGSTIFHLARMAYPTFRMMQCNSMSVRRGYVKMDAMIDAPEQRALLTDAGFDVTYEAFVYAGQSVLHAATKPGEA